MHRQHVSPLHIFDAMPKISLSGGDGHRENPLLEPHRLCHRVGEYNRLLDIVHF